jgi:hypothetical protein
MVKTLQQAADKWVANTSNAGEKWKANVAKGDYCNKFSEFVGHPVSLACNNWRNAITAVSAADFQKAISGKVSKYIDGLRSVQ